MTVGELARQLAQYPDTMRVVIRGYEGGLEDVDGAGKLPIRLNQNSESYYGPHAICSDADKHEDAVQIY